MNFKLSNIGAGQVDLDSGLVSFQGQIDGEPATLAVHVTEVFRLEEIAIAVRRQLGPKLSEVFTIVQEAQQCHELDRLKEVDRANAKRPSEE